METGVMTEHEAVGLGALAENYRGFECTNRRGSKRRSMER